MTETTSPQQSISVIITTTSTPEQAKTLGRHLVAQQLAACVQISEIQSIYSWKGNIEEDEEQRLMIKVVREREDQALSYIKNNHPYDTPEIIVSSFVSDTDYYSWCRKVSGLQ